MNKRKIFSIKPFVFILLLFCSGTVFSQSVSERSPVQTQSSGSAANASATELPLRKLALFSSGLGFFEHSGTVSSSASSPAAVNLRFSFNAVNDALKSLVINDPISDFPVLSYSSASALYETLRSLRIDLSGNPGAGEILGSMRGAEITITAPHSVSGRILNVEYRRHSDGLQQWLSLFTDRGIESFMLNEINSFSFKDPAINADIARALDLILGSDDSGNRDFLLTLPGEGSRNVSLSYVIPVPVWKVSYRLDLGATPSSGRSFFQGWAIVDNDSDTDWKDIELSLVTGRPVSFIQNLYAPYHTSRPIVPLAIAGVAESSVYESGSAKNQSAYAEAEMLYESMERARVMNDSVYSGTGLSTGPASPAPAPSSYQSAETRQAGDQFEFTLRNRISIDRRRSAMLPLTETFLQAEKTLVFQGARASVGVSMNPSISAELTNTSGMKLPAGPITVYDGGTYAGDALLEFFPENEKRLISFGDDLTVTGTISNANSRTVTAVSVTRGVMTISRKQSNERTYSFRNASAEEKRIVIEHPINPWAELSQPQSYDEATSSLYRFNRILPANQEFKFTVIEDQPISERIVLSQLRSDVFLSYTTNQEIPQNIRAALARAVELRGKVDEAVTARQNLEDQYSRLVNEQDRFRRNLEAAGNQTTQGQDYLRRMAAIDSEIDELNLQIREADQRTASARRDYDDYLSELSL